MPHGGRVKITTTDDARSGQRMIRRPTRGRPGGYLPPEGGLTESGDAPAHRRNARLKLVAFE